ncbi:MAG: ribbon-helix-helix protein, CopG family [Candidatus Thermoplasmatota archaeon]|nr:ribbon-helix-helix protein, CopG family [Candidatus Thermoplasmatota archaeon]
MATQVNVRLDDDLIQEMDSLARVMRLSRTEYIRLRLAQAVQNDSLNMTDVIVLEYAKGRIDDEELKELLGDDAEDIKFIIEHIRKGKKKIDDLIERDIL